MKKQITKSAQILSAVILLAASARAETFSGTASVEFKGTSTLHEFEGRVEAKPFTGTVRKEEKTGKLLVTASTEIKVMEMTTENKKRDKNMFKMFDAKNYPLIYGALSDAPIPTEGSAEIPLKIKIRDVQHEVVATISDFKHDGNQASCRMVFSVSLKAFGLKAPSVMGLIRVGDTVTIECLVKGTLK